MFHDTALDDWLLEFDSTPAEKMIAALRRIHADYPAAQAKAAQAMRLVHDRQRHTMSTVTRILAAARLQ